MLVVALSLLACVVTAFLLRLRATWRRQGRITGVLYYAVCNSIEFLIPLTSVCVLYSLAYVVVWGLAHGDTVAVGVLLDAEEQLQRVRSLVAHLVPTPATVLILYVVMFGIGLLGLPGAAVRYFFRGSACLRSWTRRGYIALVLLCSLTIFGLQPGSPSRHLQLRLHALRAGYGDVIEIVEDLATQEVVARSLPKVRGALPPAYLTALDSLASYTERRALLEREYAAFQSEFSVRHPETEEALRGPYTSTVSKANHSEMEPARGETAVRSPVLRRNLSARSIAELRTSAEQLGRARESRRLELLRAAGGQEVLCQIPKVVTWGLKRTFFAAVADAYPILNPLIDGLVRTVDQEVEARISSSMDRILAEANRTTLDDAINRAAEQVVEATPARVPASTLDAAVTAAHVLNREATAIREARVHVGAQRSILHADRLIEQLSSESGETRSRSADELAGLSNTLARRQVEQLTTLMEHGTEEWELYVDERWEGSYCYKRYRKASVREYAARALRSATGSHLPAALRKEAERMYRVETQESRYYTRTYI